MTREERYVTAFTCARDAIGRPMLFYKGRARYIRINHAWVRARRLKPRRTHQRWQKILYVSVLSKRISRLLTLAAFPEIVE